MKNCTDCVFAEWKRTVSGKLHPSGDGRCTFEYKFPPLPESMHFITKPYVSYGSINRKTELNDHCVYWNRRKIE